jgi:hypothetical protein
MNVRLSLLVALAALVAAAPGCSSSDNGPPKPQTEDDLDWNTPHPIVLRQDAVLAPQAISNSVVLSDNQIEIPTTGADLTVVNGWIGKLDVGKVIAGDRDSRSLDTSTNSTGFLRRITAISKLPDKVVLTTTRANLPDLIEDGDLVFDPANPTGSIFSDLSGLVKTQSLHPLGGTAAPAGEPSSGSGEGHGSGRLKTDVGGGPFVSFDVQSVKVNAGFTGTIKFRKWWKIPTGVERAAAKLTLDPEILADFDAGYNLGAGIASGATKEGEEKFASIPVPMGGPIPINLRLEMSFGCRVSATGQFAAHGSLEGRGHAAGGFDYQNGNMTNTSEGPTFDSNMTVSNVNGKASFALDCGPSVGIKLLAFDGIGLEGKIGLYGNITGEFCAIYDVKTGNTKTGFDAFYHFGPRMELSGLLQVPLLGAEFFNYGLLSWETHTENRYIVGDKHTCEFEEEAKDAGSDSEVPVDTKTLLQQAKTDFAGFDSCKGRQDGIYCSELSDYGSIVCQGEQILYGLQCPSPGKCTGPNGPGTQLYCDGKPVGGGGGGTDGGTAVDSCASKADGIYCSVLSPTAAYQCKGGSTSAGYQCPSGKSCSGPNGPGSAIVCN